MREAQESRGGGCRQDAALAFVTRTGHCPRPLPGRSLHTQCIEMHGEGGPFPTTRHFRQPQALHVSLGLSLLGMSKLAGQVGSNPAWSWVGAARAPAVTLLEATEGFSVFRLRYLCWLGPNEVALLAGA